MSACKIKKTKAAFRILKNWRITYDPKSKYKGQCFISFNKNKAVIYAFGRRPIPKDYFLHELLHCAIRALIHMKKNSKEQRQAEELLIQDICKFKIKVNKI